MPSMEETVLEGVQEYCEELPVSLRKTNGIYNGGPDNTRIGYGRWVVNALNESGFNSTQIDVIQLLRWLKKNRPDLVEEAFASEEGGAS